MVGGCVRCSEKSAAPPPAPCLKEATSPGGGFAAAWKPPESELLLLLLRLCVSCFLTMSTDFHFLCFIKGGVHTHTILCLDSFI